MNEKSFAQIKQRVSYLLKNFPETRSDDNKLLFKYIELFHPGVLMHDYFLRIHPITRFETIRRTRQKIQNEENLFKPDNKVTTARLINQAKIQSSIKDW